jgi:ABC-type transport system involved in multi-copper enzyme maturation permease subunit
LRFFYWICALNVLLISVSGISYFVTAVTEEKDSGTLALLRLAGVTPLAIVLSKSTSRLISSLMLLLIQLPFTFLAITLGGVTWEQIIAAYLALAAFLCMVANVALFCSVRCNTSGRAASLASALLILFFTSGPILLGVAQLTGVPWISPIVINACEALHNQQQRTFIWTRVEDILSTGKVATFMADQFYRNVGVGMVMFFSSILMFNRYSEPVEDETQGRSASVRRLTVGRCWRAPIVWKDFLFMTGGKPFLIVKSIGYGLLLGGFVWFHQLEHPGSPDWLSRDLTWTLFQALALLLSVEMLLYASNSLFLEVRHQTLAPLRMLPIQTPVVLLQKVAACVLALSPGFCSLLLLMLYRPNAIFSDRQFAEQATSWLFLALLSTHLTVLLSLYTRWAALPLAILITFVSFGCFLPLAAGLGTLTRKVAAINGIPLYVWVGLAINFLWMWLFVLLPIELEIISRWNHLSRE